MGFLNYKKEFTPTGIRHHLTLFPAFNRGGIKFSFRKKVKSGAPIPYDDVYYENKPCYLSICSIFKDEAPYLKEWIEYHLLAGVERFYLYDNDSTDNPLEILKPYIEKGIVAYHKIEGTCRQFVAYRDAIYKYKRQTKWMAIIDLDEFIVPVEKNDIKEFLKDYEKHPGVVVNQQVFDSNGHKTKPEAPVIESYTRISKEYGTTLTGQIKSIVQPSAVDYIYSAHWAHFKNHKLAVYPNLVKVPENTYGICYNHRDCMPKIQLNHYYSKSEEEYFKRCSRNYANMNTERPVMQSFLNFYGETEEELTIQKFLPELKERLKN